MYKYLIFFIPSLLLADISQEEVDGWVMFKRQTLAESLSLFEKNEAGKKLIVDGVESHDDNLFVDSFGQRYYEFEKKD